MKKQLIPAIAMALLGATALGGSTFAWFSANTTASASGLQISAKAAASLLVSGVKGSGYAASATLTKTNSPSATVEPVEIKEAEAGDTELKFQKLTDSAKLDVGANGKIADGDKKVQDTTTDYVKSAVYLMYSGDKANPTVDVTCTLANQNVKDSIWKAVTVKLCEQGTTTVVSTFTFSENTGESPKLETTCEGTAISVVSAVEKALDIYVYVDGNDDDCYNSAAVNGDSYSVSFEFSIESDKK